MDQTDLVDQGNQYAYTPAPDSRPPIQRDNDTLGPFILDQLMEAGEEMRDMHLQELHDKYKDDRDFRKDRDLLRPFQDAQAMAERMMEQGNYEFSEELKLIATHVDEIYIAYKKSPVVRMSSALQRRNRGKPKVSESSTTEFARQFFEGPPTFVTGDVRAVKASCAYTKCTATFAFAVAHRDLCAIKATASGDVPTTRLIAETMDIRPSFLRVLGRSGGD